MKVEVARQQMSPNQLQDFTGLTGLLKRWIFGRKAKKRVLEPLLDA